MNGNTAVAVRGTVLVGAMVRSATSVYIYWRGERFQALRLGEASGRPRSQLLDGCGERFIPLNDGQADVYVNDLRPGRLYYAEAGVLEQGRFVPLLGTAPVQTPWEACQDRSTFPAPYHRS